VDGFTSCADNFVSVVVGFATMAEYIIFVGYSFESAVNNTASTSSQYMLGVAGFAAVADYPSQRPVWPLVFMLLFLPSSTLLLLRIALRHSQLCRYRGLLRRGPC
jgi:hypothetical protein